MPEFSTVERMRYTFFFTSEAADNGWSDRTGWTRYHAPYPAKETYGGEQLICNFEQRFSLRC